MFAFPQMLIPAAKAAGMAYPEHPEKKYKKTEFPHFFIFSVLQLNRRMPFPGVAFDNAKVVVGIPVKELKKMTQADFEAKGFQF